MEVVEELSFTFITYTHSLPKEVCSQIRKDPKQLSFLAAKMKREM